VATVDLDTTGSAVAASSLAADLGIITFDTFASAVALGDTGVVAAPLVPATFSAALSLSSSYAPSFAQLASFSSHVSLADSYTVGVTSYALWLENIYLRDSGRARDYVGGVPRPSKTVLVVNLETGATSRYENFEFDKLEVVDGVLYGTNADGVFRIGGDTDAGLPINASISLGKTDLDSAQIKTLHDLYVGGRSDKPMKVRVRSQVGDFVYTADADSTLIKQLRAKLGRGLRSSYFGVEVYNDQGADFEIDEIRVHASEGARRV
jgi:hypothetical protein